MSDLNDVDGKVHYGFAPDASDLKDSQCSQLDVSSAGSAAEYRWEHVHNLSRRLQADLNNGGAEPRSKKTSFAICKFFRDIIKTRMQGLKMKIIYLGRVSLLR